MTSENRGPRNSFTFEWRIEKFAYWQEVAPRYYVLSPRFYAMPLDAGIWNLKLFPNGRNQGDAHIGMTLRSLTNTSVSVDVDCEWSILGSDGSPLNVATLKNKFITGGCTVDLPRGPTSEQVFVTQKTAFLPSGNLTLRLRIWRSERDLQESEYVFGCTQVDVRKDSYKWCINNFSDIPLKKPRENSAGVNFSPYTKHPVGTNLTLTGETLEDSNVRFEIFLKELEPPLWIKIKLFFLDSDFKVMKSYVKNRIFKTIRTLHTTRIWTIQNLISRREILLKCLRDDALTMRFEMHLIPQYSSFVERSCRGEDNIERCISRSPSVGTVQDDGGLVISPKRVDSMALLSEDFRVAFENHTLSDFELRSGKASFPVHKIVLSARSLVFRDMFCGKTTKSNFMDVPDLDPSTLETMLRFLYSGIVAGLEWASAIKLYYAACKFQVLSLKRECWNALRTDTTVKNVVDVLQLADKLNDTELTSFARNFISDHFDDVIRSPLWEGLLVTHSYLAANTMREIYMRKVDEFRFLTNRC